MTAKTASKAQAIVAEVRRRIVDREWRQGDRIPDEAELAVEFGAARATVNKALQLLAEEGILERKRRAGTHVTVNPARRATLTIPIAREQIERAGMQYGYRLIAQKRSPAPPDLARDMHLPEGAALIHLRAVHYGDGTPFQFEDRWINPAAIASLPPVDFRAVNANEWLVRNAPYSHASLTFTAANADRREARLLRVPPGAALLVLKRTTWSEVGAITQVRVSCAPAYSVSAEIG